MLELLAVDALDRLAEHLNEAAPRIEGKALVLVRAARPLVVSSFRPRFRTVSIIPGMENFAPERTLTSSGSFRSPNFLAALRSRIFSAGRICSHTPFRNLAPVAEFPPDGLGAI